MISELLEDTIIKAGKAKSVAAEIGITPGKLSNVRSGAEGLTLEQINRLLQASDYQLVHREHYQELKQALKTVSHLWMDADKETR